MNEDPENLPVQRTVLLADHKFSWNHDLLQRLQSAGFRICLADSIEVATRYIQEQPIPYAITDLFFRDGDGFSIVETMLKRNPRARILVHSEYCDLRSTVRAVKLGVADVLPKPSDTTLLLALLLGNDVSEPASLPVLSHPRRIRDEHIRSVLAHTGANISLAARQLSMHRRTLQRRIKKMPSTFLDL